MGASKGGGFGMQNEAYFVCGRGVSPLLRELLEPKACRRPLDLKNDQLKASFKETVDE